MLDGKMSGTVKWLIIRVTSFGSPPELCLQHRWRGYRPRVPASSSSPCCPEFGKQLPPARAVSLLEHHVPGWPNCNPDKCVAEGTVGVRELESQCVAARVPRRGRDRERSPPRIHPVDDDAL